MVNRELVLQIPKVELHVHFEGSIQPASLLELARKNKIELPYSNETDLQKWFEFRDFPHFVDVYVAMSGAIQTPEDLEFLAKQFAENQAAQNIIYTEATFTAETIFRKSGIPFHEQIDALQRGIEQVAGTTVKWIIDIVRDWDTETGERIAQWCIEGKEKGVVGLGLSGFELKEPLQKHQAAFSAAKSAGLGISAHAGETQGPASILEVLDVIQADRVGHGVRCLEDPFLVQRLRDSQVHLEVNPSSNVRLGVFPDLESHPLPRMLDEGLNVSINSDDPPLFGTTLTDEWVRCLNAFELPIDITYSLNRNALDAAFLPEDRRRTLKRWLIDGTNQALSSVDS